MTIIWFRSNDGHNPRPSYGCTCSKQVWSRAGCGDISPDLRIAMRRSGLVLNTMMVTTHDHHTCSKQVRIFARCRALWQRSWAGTLLSLLSVLRRSLKRTPDEQLQALSYGCGCHRGGRAPPLGGWCIFEFSERHFRICLHRPGRPSGLVPKNDET